MPEAPLQGAYLTHLYGDLYDLRAVSVMPEMTAAGVADAGVLRYQATSEVYTAIVTATPEQIRGFAAYYGGVAIHRHSGNWIVKAIAPGMRQHRLADEGGRRARAGLKKLSIT